MDCYDKKMVHIYINKFRALKFNLWQTLNCKLLKTYRPYANFARCDECGRDVHDFQVPDDLWNKVEGNKAGTLCYDCFCDKAEKKLGKYWRMWIDFRWRDN